MPELLAERCGAKTVLTDTGQLLNGALLNQGLVDEISLPVLPIVVGQAKYSLWDGGAGNVRLELGGAQAFPGGKVWLTCRVARAKQAPRPLRGIGRGRRFRRGRGGPVGRLGLALLGFPQALGLLLLLLGDFPLVLGE